MNFFQKMLAKSRVRFFSTAGLIDAYALIERAEYYNELILEDKSIQDGKRIIFRELARRGDDHLLI
jgi:hypothetical protein